MVKNESVIFANEELASCGFQVSVQYHLKSTWPSVLDLLLRSSGMPGCSCISTDTHTKG